MTQVSKGSKPLLRFIGLTFAIAIAMAAPLFPLFLVSDYSSHELPQQSQYAGTPQTSNGVIEFFRFAVLYMSLSNAWIISYSVCFRYPEKFRLLLTGFLICAPLMVLAFYSPMAKSSLSSAEVNILLAGAIGVCFTAAHFAMFVNFFHRLKIECRRIVGKRHSGRHL